MPVPPTVNDLRGWLKRPHTEDDAQIHQALVAVVSKWKAATGRTELQLTEEEYLAMRMEIAHVESFRGDDAITPQSPLFVETVRRMHNGNAVG
jgi:hypothetical protein